MRGKVVFLGINSNREQPRGKHNELTQMPRRLHYSEALCNRRAKRVPAIQYRGVDSVKFAVAGPAPSGPRLEILPVGLPMRTSGPPANKDAPETCF